MTKKIENLLSSVQQWAKDNRTLREAQANGELIVVTRDSSITIGGRQ